MMPTSDSDILTRVGPGTPMGGLMREYWLPAAMSSEIEADGPPVRLMILGEKLLAFRDTAGTVGIMDHRCPHRCASLFFGRNEEGGLRCGYHGWKFDTDGNCIDMPNVPPHQDYKHKVRAKTYKVAERNGLIWVYMGARETAPPLPAIEATLLPHDQTHKFCVQRECNWMQAVEGEIDTSHFSFLHYGGVDADRLEPGHMSRFNATDSAPQLALRETDWGTMYGGYRPAGDGKNYWRIANYMMPFWTIPPDGPFGQRVWARAWVPMDDEHTMFFQVAWNQGVSGLREYADGEPIPGLRQSIDYRPNDTGWFGRWRPEGNEGNDYLLDRDVQKTESYSGIDGLYMQDQAITESMGKIVDRELEHLGPSDRMVIETRKRLIGAALALQNDGTLPPGADNPDIFLGARGGEFMIDEKDDWIEVYEDAMRAMPDPSGALAAAAAAE